MNVKRILSALVLSLAVCCLNAFALDKTALDEYVEKDDPNYSFVHERTRTGEGYTVFVIRMTSQAWRSSPDEVDRSLWDHELLVVVPWITHSGNQNTALLVVNGGTNTAQRTDENDRMLGILATVTGSVVAMVSQVPNQRLTFADEVDSRIEDELLAYGMDKYLVTGDPEWLVQLPMTKAVVRAMDTVQTFAAEADFTLPVVPRIDDFIVLGGSKRGWATWLAGAVEAGKGEASRVRAIVPVSIDLLNMDEQFLHHWDAYGFYAPAIQDYATFDLPCRALTPAGQAMLEIIDPYEYRDRLTMPKLVLNSTGDQFFLPDSSRFYFDALPGPKQLRYTLNTDHSQAQDLISIVAPTISWLSEVLDNDPSPRFTWDLAADGSIRVNTVEQPDRVRLWQVTNPQTRDFRLETLKDLRDRRLIDDLWTSTRLEPTAPGEYVGYVAPPAEGWTAFTVELTFAGSTLIPTPLESDQVFTTDVRVTPSTLPFHGENGGCEPYQPPPNRTEIFSSVLPASRSVMVGTAATAFATILNTASVQATSCGIRQATTLPGALEYQTTDPITNVPTGTANTPANIAPGGLQTFVFAFTPSSEFEAREMHLQFDCTNTDPAPIVEGINTLLLSASTTPVPDILALAATPSADGIVNIQGNTGTGVFAVATANVGASGRITASAAPRGEGLPIGLSLCETNPTTSQCINPTVPTTGSVTTSIDADETPTFAIFVDGRGNVRFDPANNRIFVQFKDAGGVTRGATSVAVRTQ